LANVIPNNSNLSLPVTENLWEMSRDDAYALILRKFKDQFPTVQLNQIEISACNYDTSEAMNSQIVTVVLSVINGSPIYSPGSVSCTFGIPLQINSYRYRTNDGT
jgi:hypothetical protein